MAVRPGLLTWAQLAQRMSFAPARIAGLSGQGRPIEVGEPANLVLIDPDTAWTVDREASHSLSRNNPWHGRTLPAPVVATFLRGECTAYRCLLYTSRCV